jgi:aryl-alcohol dehydrogenase-like predicted oxidoreductase
VVASGSPALRHDYHDELTSVLASSLAKRAPGHTSLGFPDPVQNFYNLAVRADDALVDRCAEQGIAFVPFFPLGGFRPLQSGALDEVAVGLGISRPQVAMAWLLQRSPTILLIPGTSSVAHLRENAAW